MWIAKTIAECRARRGQIEGEVAFVPTMGALHAGHVSLMDIARTLAEHVVVSIFVNPAQFGPQEDYTRYPRPLEHDLELCREAGVAGVFQPAAAEMYPPEQLPTEIAVPALVGILEGAVRPGHFAGVCRAVAKLFNIVQPDIACFGQKDLQQLRIIQALVVDLDFPLRVAACPTMRESDGLAMSSRNAYLSTEDRRRAVGLFKALSEAKMLVEQAGETDPAVVERAMAQVMQAHHVQVDYAVVRHPLTLAEVDTVNPALTDGVAALVAGRLGSTRLIDNVLLGVVGAS